MARLKEHASITVPRLDTVAWLLYIARRQLTFRASFQPTQTTFHFPTLTQVQADALREAFHRQQAG
jgi:hypothetical protein